MYVFIHLNKQKWKFVSARTQPVKVPDIPTRDNGHLLRIIREIDTK